MHKTNTAVTVTSSTSDVLRLFGATLTRKVTVLSELMQNARRAKSDAVHFEVDENTVTIIDRGTGIEDLSVLLAVAKSGWDGETIRTESPYGAGWLSSLFACKELIVSSKGQRMQAKTDDLIDLKPALVESIDDAGETRISLIGQSIGTTHQIQSAIQAAAKGFPIPVFINGNEVARKDAVDESFIKTPIGYVSAGILKGKLPRHFYLQGLPVTSFSLDRYLYEPGVAHLDPTLFKGRMPDRDQLIEPEAARKLIIETLNGVIKDHLKAMAKKLSPEAFVETYADLAVEHGLREELNAIPFIPGNWVQEYREIPGVEPADSNALVYPVHSDGSDMDLIDKSEVEDRGIYVFVSDDSNLICRHFTHRTNAFIATSRIPEWHWAWEMAKELEPDELSIEAGKVLGEETLEVHGWTVGLRLVESLSIKRDADGLTCQAPTHFQWDGYVLYATPEASPLDIVWQVTNFEDDERKDEEAEDRAIQACRALLKSFVESDPADLLGQLLSGALPNRVPEILRGKKFIMQISENGSTQFSLME